MKVIALSFKVDDGVNSLIASFVGLPVHPLADMLKPLTNRYQIWVPTWGEDYMPGGENYYGGSSVSFGSFYHLVLLSITCRACGYRLSFEDISCDYIYCNLCSEETESEEEDED